tara:strand:- start:37 stop:288 length:252 start_codon:yes stop_codon:yes gene_type:complete
MLEAPKGTPLYRLQRVLIEAGATESVLVLAGDVADCGDNSVDLAKVLPGELITITAGELRSLLSGPVKVPEVVTASTKNHKRK